MSLGTNIYNLRKEKGYSQEDLANRCNVSRQAISKWEADEVMPDTNNLLTLSKLFNITIDELINNPVNAKQPDVFDKSVNLVKKHWAKIGYRFIISGAIAIGFSLLVKAVTKSFFYSANSMFNEFPDGLGFDIVYNDPFSKFQNTASNIFGMMSIFVMIIGVVSLIGGLGLVIYDYKKNHPKNI